MSDGEWRKVWVSVGATVGLLALVWLVNTALAQGQEEGDTLEGDVSLAAMVAGKINYQGRLTDLGGAPLDGTFPMRFQIYASSSGGSPLWDSGVMSVAVDGGLFNVQLSVSQADFNGQALWLAISVDGDWLSPRQELVAVPYALSLRPGAFIKGEGPSTCSAVLDIENDGGDFCGKGVFAEAATGSAVWGTSPGGWAVRGYSENNYAVFGSGGTTTQGHGYGGYFESTTGVGVYGYSSATSVASNPHAPGVYGRSANRVGVLGVSDAASGGEGGLFQGANGISAWGSGSAPYDGIGGDFGGRIGVRATSTGSLTQDGYAGKFESEHYRALYVEAAPNWFDAYFAGNFGILVQGDIVAYGSKTGYVVDVALNDGPDALELGDVVVITGAAEPILGSIPVPMVQKATEAYSTGVIGVVDRRFVTSSGGLSGQETEAESPGYFEDSSQSLAEGRGIGPGEYVGVVTLGSFQAIKVDASYGAIQPGDLLVSSETPGHSMKATDPQVGTVIGKALGSLDSGTGVIPVLITLQ
jgi:hypothetical protein